MIPWNCFFGMIFVQLMVNWWLWVGGLDSCDPLVKGIAAWVYP